MTPKVKLILLAPAYLFRGFRARKIAKKIKKANDDERYPAIWRNNKVLKSGKKFLKLLNIDLEVIGFENIPKSTSLLTPNHTSSIDATALLVALENPEKGPDYSNYMPTFLGKEELKKNRKFVGYMDILGTFYIDRKKPREALKVIDDMVIDAKEKHKQIVIFPEGTRSPDGTPGDFKGGAFRVAKKSFIPIVPVTINNTLAATNFNRKERLKVQIIFHEPMKPMSFMTMDTKSVGERVKKIVESKLVIPTGRRPKKEENIV